MMLIHLLPANDNIGGEGYLVLFGGGGTRDGQPQIRIDGFARLMAGIMTRSTSLHQLEIPMSRLRKLPIGPQLQHDRGRRKTRSKREFILTHEVVGNRGQLE